MRMSLDFVMFPEATVNATRLLYSTFSTWTAPVGYRFLRNYTIRDFSYDERWASNVYSAHVAYTMPLFNYFVLEPVEDLYQ